jgi:L-lactate dehydrogenase complex protein LldG
VVEAGAILMERSEFLARTRTAIFSASIPTPDTAEPGALVPDMIDVDLAMLFVDAATAVGAEVHHGDPHSVVEELVQRYSIESFLSWDVDQIRGLASLPDSIVRLDAVIPDEREARRDRNERFAEVGMGITGAEAGFAETGTIVVRSGAGRPRMASLVPIVHVAVLSTERIARSLSHWMADPNARPADATNVVFITGPSKTGDIESIITTGVHGPRHLHICLLAD